MRHTLLTTLAGLMLLALAACQTHFISDADYRRQVEEDFETRKRSLPEGELFAVFDTDLSTYECEALQFLYAYMPLADLADFPGDFHLMNLRSSRRALEEMPWGGQVTEELFRHFVLPARVNNAVLDSARVVLYEELKPRVRQLSMSQAVLEVNHWCHEHVVYRPTDARTSSPLATIRTAYGRCGEESTLLVAALRSVGIPARQVYTPRWAHTDDNHAWVEAWADGAWHFLGACEPEPVLDLGWFNAPASRGMLMHTKVFGRYEGPEEVMGRTPCHTEINVVGNYAPTARAEVLVTDRQGEPVADACVEFKLYNYAEFYTVATKRSDAQGRCSLTAGKGDMLVWASKGGQFGFAKLSFGQQEQLTVSLDRQVGEPFEAELDMVPPAEQVRLPEVSAALRAENDRRLAAEDSIRHAYEATMMDEEEALAFARRYRFDQAEEVARLLVASRGNHGVLCNFMARLRSDKSKKGGLKMLEGLSSKDLRDVSLEVLTDHMQTPVADLKATLYYPYVRNPRIANEHLTPYKLFFGKAFPREQVEQFRAHPQELVAWTARHIRTEADCNSGALPMSPRGVWKARVADPLSRNIFFVALARSLSIPARIDEVTGKVQLLSEEGASDVDFEATEAPMAARRGKLTADYRPNGIVDNPKYYNHFTLSRMTAEGRLQLLNYEEEFDGKEGANWDNLLRRGTWLDGGSYLLVTGTRLADGTVLARMEALPVGVGEKCQTQLQMRSSSDKVAVIGSFNSELLFTPLQADGTLAPAPQSFLAACGRGYFVVGILGVGQEPTNHALRDIAAVQSELEAWGRTLVLLFPDEVSARKFRPAEFPGLPAGILWGVDTEGVTDQVAEAMKLKGTGHLPLFLLADTFNRVVFASHGYTIGLGEQVVKTIRGL